MYDVQFSLRRMIGVSWSGHLVAWSRNSAGSGCCDSRFSECYLMFSVCVCLLACTGLCKKVGWDLSPSFLSHHLSLSSRLSPSIPSSPVLPTPSSSNSVSCCCDFAYKLSLMIATYQVNCVHVFSHCFCSLCSCVEYLPYSTHWPRPSALTPFGLWRSVYIIP